MKKYFILAFFFMFFAVILILGVYICPDFMFLLSYTPNHDSLDFICGAYTVISGWFFVVSIILLSFVTWDFFKSQSSGKEPDKNKNENKE